MAYPVDQPCMVKGFLVEKLSQVRGHLLFIGPILNLLLHFLEHLNHLNVRAAVTWALQRADGGRNDGVGVGERGGHHMGGKGGVISSAVLHM